jgi:hypothetical protein
MSPSFTSAALAALFLSVMACESQPRWERDFQSEVVSESTQADVRGKFGTPEMVTPLEDGSEIWIYRYSRGKFSTGYSAMSECREYSLTFDKKKVLRNTRQVDCSGRLPGYDPREDERYLKEPGAR